MKNLTHIHVDHCAGDISPLEFKQFCHRVWSENHNFITIDLTRTPMNGKYRQNFNRFYFLLVLYKAAIMEAYRSVIMEAFRDQFTATELLSYKEVLYEEATVEWDVQRDPDEVDREDRNLTRLARQFSHLMEEYRERFFTYVLFQSPTQSIAAHLESYLLHVYYTSHWIIYTTIERSISRSWTG